MFWLIGVLISLASSIGAAWAGPNEDCIGAQDMDVKIRGCTIQLQKGGSIKDRVGHYNNRCNGYSGKGDYDLAIADCTKAIELDPQYAFAYNNRCLNYNKKQEFERAIADCTKSIEFKNPGLQVPYKNRGDAHVGKGEWDAAIADYTRAIELLPTYDQAHQALASAIKLRDRKAKATPQANVTEAPPVEIVPAVTHAGWVESVAFSRDGTLVASGGQDGKVKLWEAATGRLIRTLRGHEKGVSGVSSVAFSPDSRRLVSGGGDNSVKLWDIVTGEFIRGYYGHTKSVKAVAFSPDGNRIASAGYDNTVIVWDAGSDRSLLTFKGHGGNVGSVAFSPDGQRILSGSGSTSYPRRTDNTAKVWDVATGRVIQSLQHPAEVHSATFSSDGGRILTGSEDKTLRLWDAGSGRLIRAFSGYSYPIYSVAFSPDGSRVYSGNIDGVRAWDALSGASAPAPAEAGSARSIAISPDGLRLVIGTMGNVVKAWDLPTGKLLSVAGNEQSNVAIPTSVAFSPDATRFATGSDTALRLWSVPASARTIQGDHTHLAYSPDGGHLLVGGRNVLKLLDAATGEQIRAIEGISNTIEAVAFSPDGKRIVAGFGYGSDTEKGKFKMWDASTGRLLTTFRGHGGGTKAVAFSGVHAVAFTPDGARIVSGGNNDGVSENAPKGNGKLRFWDPSSGQLLRSIDAHYYEITALAISPDGSRIVTGSDYDPITQGRLITSIQTVRIWDVASGQMLYSVGPNAKVNAVAFSPNGRQVIAGSDDNQIIMWDVGSGQLVRRFDGHSGAVTSVTFSRDGTRILSGSADHTVRIWDAATGELLATLMGEQQSWLTIMPAGFFATSSPTDAKALTITRGLELYDVNQMYQALYDPDLVREKLAGDPDGEVRKAAEVLDLGKVIDSGQPPDVSLIAPSSANTSTEELVTASARITDRGGGVGRVEWRVNGVTVAVVAAAGSGAERTVSQVLALEPGTNIIEVVAYNGRNLLSSLPVSTTLSWNAPPDQPRPKLFVIAVGVNEYGDTLFRRLSHAVADAKAFGAAMIAAGEGLYGQVDVTTVLDAEVTADNLERIITEVGTRMHPRDVFVFLAAAHGKTENGRFHLIPQDYRSDRPGTLTDKTIGQDKLQDWFANKIKARRGLILLDTCESGALVGSRKSGVDLGNSEAALGRLNEATGRPVLTAAAADQAALEGYKGHGVFTYAVLDALINGDANNNGQIEVSELAAHIQTLAPILSQELKVRRGASNDASVTKTRAAVALGDAPVASKLADFRQKPRMGSRGEDFPLVKKLSALPAPAAQ